MYNIYDICQLGVVRSVGTLAAVIWRSTSTFYQLVSLYFFIVLYVKHIYEFVHSDWADFSMQRDNLCLKFV